MDATLVIVGGKANKSQVSVKLPAIIGRSHEADLTVAHPMISRKHCQLYELDGLVIIRDLGSLNGTFVDQKQVSEAALHPSAEFSVGPLTFRVEYEYLGKIAPPPEAATVAEAAEPPEGGSDGEMADFQEAPQPSGMGPGPEPSEVDETLPIDAPPASEAAQAAIAPPNGQLPDTSAWGYAEARPAQQEQADAPSPPAATAPPAAYPHASTEPPKLTDPKEQADLAETQELAGSEPRAGPEAEPAQPSPPSGTTEAADVAEGQEMRPQAPVAPPPSEPQPDSAEEPTVNPPPDADKPAADGTADVAAPPESDAEEPGEADTSDDDALRKFFQEFE